MARSCEYYGSGSIKKGITYLIQIFYSYADKDEIWQLKLEKHLSTLKRNSIISTWYARKIIPGIDWMQAADCHLQSASIILLLVSPDFIASDYCYGTEMQLALQRHAAREAYVIPILIRPVDWQETPS